MKNSFRGSCIREGWRKKGERLRSTAVIKEPDSYC